GSPAWAASSIRSISRGRVKKAAVQSSLGQAQPELTQAEFENPFGGFGGTRNNHKVASHEQSNVLGFLAEEGLLTASSESSSLVTGNENRKEFLGFAVGYTACVAGAIYNGKPLKAVSTTTTTSTSTTTSNSNIITNTNTLTNHHLLYQTGSVAIVNTTKSNNAKEACITPPTPTPTSIPTLSQWGQYLLMLLLGIVGFKSRQWRDKKS
ncbi:MAG TPA: IPTL-CTERM sorting domain-containing protein, partial [Leucothrix mucor]|nr:IPTL-CTERM sorting domain-containing protein [Leucothrix mucor]